MPALVCGSVIGVGLGLVVGGAMFARVLFSFAERGEAHYVFHYRNL